MGGNAVAFDVLCIGEVLLDFVAPDADDLHTAQEFILAPGGAPANVAVAVARLGGRAAFAGAVGSDPFGERLTTVLRENGVDITGVLTVPELTTLAFVARNHGAIPDFLFYRGADAAFGTEDVPLSAIMATTFLYVSSMALLSEGSAAATLYAVEVARESGVMVALDPNLRPSSWASAPAAREALAPLLTASDILKVNEEEAKLLAETTNLDEAVRDLAADRRLVVVTLGAEGCRWRWGTAEGAAPSPGLTVRDTTGAGDAFMGALLRELARDGFTPYSGHETTGDLGRAVLFASAAGAWACGQVGAMQSLPTRANVESLLGESPQS